MKKNKTLRVNYSSLVTKGIRIQITKRILGQSVVSYKKLNKAIRLLYGNRFDKSVSANRMLYVYWWENIANISGDLDSVVNNKNFYRTPEWKDLRFRVLRMYGTACMKCGNPDEPHVDHIKPKSLYPHLALNINNLQVLCKDCNLDKSNKNCIDYRPKINS